MVISNSTWKEGIQVIEQPSAC